MMTFSDDSLQLVPGALTIAGFDPSGGAGVLADVRTFAAFGFRSAAAITSVTFQNADHFLGSVHQSGETVRAQLMPLMTGHRIVCAKTGMLPTREVITEVSRVFREYNLPSPVVDPVIRSTSGERLMEENALDTFVHELLPLACLLTPNIQEAETLTGIAITSELEMQEAAAMLRKMGAIAVLIKGGHLCVAKEAVDVLDNEGKVTVFREERIPGGELHGSGCILSAAIAAGLGKGMTLENSVSAAKGFVLEAIRNSRIEASN